MLVEVDGATLVIDPGSLTRELDVPDLVAVVVTHEHADHWDAPHLESLRAAHPGVPIYGPEGVARAAEGFDIDVVAPGETREAGPFSLAFFGCVHAEIHSSIPLVDNVGVLVNDRFAYAGDSYAEPGVPVELLAAPAGAPWLKIGEAMDFVLAVAPRRSFGTHDMTLSVIGKNMHRQRLQWATEQGGGEFFVLEPGDSLDL